MVSRTTLPERGAARARLLVLLRTRPARAVDRGEHLLHAAPAADPRVVRRPDARAAVGRARAVAAPHLLRAAHRRRRGDRGRRPPVRLADAGRRGVQASVAGVDGRVRAAQHRTRGAARRSSDSPGCSARARPRSSTGCAPAQRRRWAIAIPVLLGVAAAREPARALDRRRSTATTCSAPRRSRSTGRTRRSTSTRAATTRACSSSPAPTSASYRWGQTVDPITPGIMDRPYVARELIPYGSRGVGQPAQRVRPAAAGPQARPRLDRAADADDGRRRRHAAQRHPVRALPAAAPAVHVGPLHADAGRARRRRRRSGSRRRPRAPQFPFLDEQALLADPNLAAPAAGGGVRCAARRRRSWPRSRARRRW